MIRETAVENPAATLGRLANALRQAPGRERPGRTTRRGRCGSIPGAAYERGEKHLGPRDSPGIGGRATGFSR